MIQRIAEDVGIPRHSSPRPLRHPVITNALDAGVPLRDARSPLGTTTPGTTERYDRARGNFDRRGVRFLTAYFAEARLGLSTP